jgi:hypothetical protein
VRRSVVVTAVVNRWRMRYCSASGSRATLPLRHFGAAFLTESVELKGHLVGALNNNQGDEEAVKAVRDVLVKICEASGMKMLDNSSLDGWGWREEVAPVKMPKSTRI